MFLCAEYGKYKIEQKNILRWSTIMPQLAEFQEHYSEYLFQMFYIYLYMLSFKIRLMLPLFSFSLETNTIMNLTRYHLSSVSFSSVDMLGILDVFINTTLYGQVYLTLNSMASYCPKVSEYNYVSTLDQAYSF